jgi:tRNA(fMet)-specific endonuclease VapC
VPQAYFLDTNILVHLIRRDLLGQYLIGNYSLYTTDPRPMISDVTEGELRSLALQWKWGPQKRTHMEFVLSYFWRISINTPDVFEAYAVIDAYSESKGIPIGKNDVWIAASASVSQALLLTTDKDFDHLQSAFITRDWIDPNQFKPSSTQ